MTLKLLLLNLLILSILRDSNLFVKSEHEISHVMETTQTHTLLLNSEGSQLTNDKIDFSSTAHGNLINLIEPMKNRTLSSQLSFSLLHFEIDASDSMDSNDAIDAVKKSNAVASENPHTKKAHELHEEAKKYQNKAKDERREEAKASAEAKHHKKLHHDRDAFHEENVAKYHHHQAVHDDNVAEIKKREADKHMAAAASKPKPKPHTQVKPKPKPKETPAQKACRDACNKKPDKESQHTCYVETMDCW